MLFSIAVSLAVISLTTDNFIDVFSVDVVTVPSPSFRTKSGN